MSRNTILLEGHNLTLETGTGIATYARTLNATLRSLGHATEVVVGTQVKMATDDPLLHEVTFFDARAWNRSRTQRLAALARHAVIGSPLGICARALRLDGTVLQPAGNKLADFDRVHTVRELPDVARLHFRRYKSRPLLKLDTKPDLFHATQPIPLRVQGCPNIYTIHDLVPLRLPYATLDDKKYFLQLTRHLARTADHIVTVSEHSKRDIVELLKVPEDRVTNTYQSVQIPTALLNTSKDQLALELQHFFQLEPGGYFLFVGAIEPKKNLSRLIDAYASSGSIRPLIIVGAPGWQSERDLEKINDERFLSHIIRNGTITPRRRVQRLTYLPFERLVALTRGARAVLFPSLYEGFGLPVLEAMVTGTPVLTANVSSLPEIVGDAALLVDPHDVDSIAAGIRALDNDDDLCAALAIKGQTRAEEFSPPRYGARLAKLYRRLLG
jgi:glycosyltransferase involved in cell wall biosynthesis